MSLEQQVNQDTLKKLEATLTDELKRLEGRALKQAAVIVGQPVSVHSLNGFLGGKNNAYVDSIRGEFPSHDDFIARWINGLLDKVKIIEEAQREKYNGNIYQDTPTHRMIRLVKSPAIFNYLSILLKRNFYRNLLERTRAKPNEIHWKIWFGENQLPWGLLIAPAHRGGKWCNDVSEIRREKYMYWTIEHILNTGLIDPDSNEPLTFKSVKAFIKFYDSILKRLSRSQYEKQIVDLYIDYVANSNEPESEPFLIPELRYAGVETNHLYRLDFAVLNSHTMEFLGFELSPHSSHMAVSGVKERKQVDINNELKVKWNKEVSKRNKYFLDYGITTITFSDDDLVDIDRCFSVIKTYLSNRPCKSFSLNEQVKDLNSFIIK